ARLVEHFGEVPGGVLEDPREQILLGVDVVVEAALEDADLVGDVLDRRGRVALLVEDPDGGLDHVLAAAAPLPIACTPNVGRCHPLRNAVKATKRSGTL